MSRVCPPVGPALVANLRLIGDWHSMATKCGSAPNGPKLKCTEGLSRCCLVASSCFFDLVVCLYTLVLPDLFALGCAVSPFSCRSESGSYATDLVIYKAKSRAETAAL